MEICRWLNNRRDCQTTPAPNSPNSLDNVSQWCQRNDVLPKPAKCNLMSVCFLRNMNPPTDFTLNDVQLNILSHPKLLGITIQDDLKWNLHVENIVSKASRKLYTLCILKKCKTPIEDMVTVFCCYIRPVLCFTWVCMSSLAYFTDRSSNSQNWICTKESPSDHLG